ncbi:MAG: hypothetical protein JWN50_191 [Parcubacteria group bacterium]|nr:hypothetical protein [Parcubacteria group bacterium]
MSFKKLLVLPALVAMLGFGSSIASAQVITTAMPRVAVALETTALTNPLVSGTTGATLARLTLDTTGSNTAVRIASLPLTLSTGSGALTSSLTGCRVFNETTGGALTSGSNIPSSLSTGMNTITLDTPFVMQAGTVATLAVRCDIASNLVTGGTYQFSLNTANVVAADPITGTPAVVTLRGVVTPIPVPVPVPVIPTVPNTGAGGAATTNVALILGSLAVAGFGLAYARKATR